MPDVHLGKEIAYKEKRQLMQLTIFEIKEFRQGSKYSS